LKLFLHFILMAIFAGTRPLRPETGLFTDDELPGHHLSCLLANTSAPEDRFPNSRTIVTSPTFSTRHRISISTRRACIWDRPCCRA
jgi:hypothetical protein